VSNKLSFIEVAGVVHEDPLGLERLKRWLSSLGFTAESKPAFVAVEYDPFYLSRLVAERSSFRTLVEREWPFLSKEDYTTLEKSLGYDGDAHVDIFPNSETIWLDEGRWGAAVESVATGLAKRRMQILCSSAKSIPQQCDGFLCRLSQKAWADAKANRSPNGDERDRLFSKLVTARANHQISNRAIAIVGASHARSKISDSFVSLVKADGIGCRIEILESC
jgi:hypothetical protein